MFELHARIDILAAATSELCVDVDENSDVCDSLVLSTSVAQSNASGTKPSKAIYIQVALCVGAFTLSLFHCHGLHSGILNGATFAINCCRWNSKLEFQRRMWILCSRADKKSPPTIMLDEFAWSVAKYKRRSLAESSLLYCLQVTIA